MKKSPAALSGRSHEFRLLPWIALLVIVVGYLLLVVHLHPTNFFGLSQDDTLYFSSAMAIAEGRGYILPSVPGTPPATKYPILYPWLLSGVWRWNPSFPANLSLALALNLSFGAAYLSAAFVFLRRLPGFNNVVALVLTAACAVNPRVLFLSANLMSDIPFAAFALGACIMAAKANDKEASAATVTMSAIFSGLSLLVRAMGLPIAAGLFVAIAVRNGRKRAIVFAAYVLPFIVALLWRSIALAPQMPPFTGPHCSQSWRMTWLYYTRYAGFWREDVLSHGVFYQTAGGNIVSTLLQPASYFVNRTFLQPPVLALILVVSLSAVAIRGIFRLGNPAGWQPIHFALGLSLLPILVWNYAALDRFLLPFLPLICAGTWVEVRRIWSQLQTSRNANGEQRIAAGFFCVVAIALLWSIGVSWWGEVYALARISQSRAALLDERREAYAWLEQRTPPDSRVLAYEDAIAFLYSHRQGLRPVIFSPSGIYRPEILASELDCIVSSAKPIGANYWLVSDDDFGYEWEPASSRGREKEKGMERTLNPVFRSAHGGVRIYQLDAYGQPAL
jgi:hypothetical protein